jgi:outer membrane protein TolC
VTLVFLVACGLATRAVAQPPTPMERVTFQQAIDRAVRNNPTAAVAAAGILRAEGLVNQARAATRPFVNGNITTITLNQPVEFSNNGNSITVTPRTQATFAMTADAPIVAAAAWARRAQAQDNVMVAELSAAETRRQIALSTADAYLSIIAARRVVDGNIRARDAAKAHYDLAAQLEQQGTGSRLNALRAQQQFSTNDALVEASELAVYRAQEALGVLLVADGAVDVVDEPAFDLPPDADEVANQPNNFAADLLAFRSDLKLFSGQVQAADRVVRDSSRDWWPTLDAVFLPQSIGPSGAFVNPNSWRFLLQSSIPIFDSGQRASLKVQRQSALDVAQANLTGAISRASSEVRVARAAIASSERGLVSARAAADQAQQVLNIVNISFRAGAATNIEVIDAERSARDIDLGVAVAEDNLRRARLDLLLALGRFP